MRITGRAVAQVAATLSGLPVEELLCGSSRKREVARVRQAAMWAARRMRPDLSYPALGRVYTRDHTTVIAACRVVDDRRGKDPDILAFTDALMAECEKLALAPEPQPGPTGLRTKAQAALLDVHWPPRGGRGKRAAAKQPLASRVAGPKLHPGEIEPGRYPQDNWDRWLVEPWAQRKARLARERADKAAQAATAS